MAEDINPIRIRRITRLGGGRDNLISFAETLIDPAALTLSLWYIGILFEGHLTLPYLVASLVVFSMTFPGLSRLDVPVIKLARDIALGWLAVAGLMLLLAYTAGYLNHYDRGAIQMWLWLAPFSVFGAHLAFRTVVPAVVSLQGGLRNCVIAGMNTQGVALARRIERDPYMPIKVQGFFDDRGTDRIEGFDRYSLLGKLKRLPEYVRENNIQIIYLSLPMVAQSRILDLLDQLRDTTASIYFVPDIFITDVIQGRMDSVQGMPVVCVCESPFTGMNGLLKRISDFFFALFIVLLISPVLAIIAIAVKLSSPGPVIFKQRRYGQDGQEIYIYKFRSMTVTEDGSVVTQAKKNDARITPLGAFLRKTSLDELPQFLNVLQGRMSIVGPRPHAVAHNEQYRKLIKGYMVRHKVKPGITGWAQVNGARGETDTIDKMKTRIEYDLDYLRNWSLRLDTYIIFRTLAVVLNDRNAY
jgi:putative colanic acid biosynthesis UDP-glucose lipid carrier transferase